MAETELRWATQFPELGTDPVPIESCTSPEIFAREIEQIYRKVWLCVARDEEVPIRHSYSVVDQYLGA